MKEQDCIMWLTDEEVRREFIRLVDVHLYSYDSLFWLVDIIEIGDQLDLSETRSHELMLSLIEDGFVQLASGTDGSADLSFEQATVVTLTAKGLELIGKTAPGESIEQLIAEIECFLRG